MVIQYKKIRHLILDRDGVLNQEAPGGFVRTPDEWAWIPGVLDGLSMLSSVNILLSIASNQSCIGRGIIDATMLDRIHDKMRLEAEQYNIRFAGIHCCPHDPDAGCDCRKPKSGLLEQAICASGILRESTVFIGDAERDLQAGKAAGIDVWLVRTGKGVETEASLKHGRIQGIDQKKVGIFNNLYDACLALAACG